MELKPIEKLEILLKRDNISKKELASRLGLGASAVSNLFNADNISINKLSEVARAAGYDLIIDFEKIEK